MAPLPALSSLGPHTILDDLTGLERKRYLPVRRVQARQIEGEISVLATDVTGAGRVIRRNRYCAVAVLALWCQAALSQADAECRSREWQLIVSAPSADRELAARLGAVALEASGGTVTMVNDVTASDLFRVRYCYGVARLEVTRNATGVSAALALTALPGLPGQTNPVRAIGTGVDLGVAIENAFQDAHGSHHGVPLVALLPPPPCDSARPSRVRALLIGVHEAQMFAPDFPGRGDVPLMEKAISARYPDASITKVLGAAGTRAALHRSLTNLVQDTHCGDLVFIHFSGFAFKARREDKPPDDPEDRDYSRVPNLGEHDEGRPALALFDLNPITESTLRGFVTALRNRRAFVVVLLDAPVTHVNLCATWRRSSAAEAELLRGAGDCAVMTSGAYATARSSFLGGQAGLLSIATTVAFQNEEALTVRSLIEAVSQNIGHLLKGRSSHAYFEASNPDTLLFPAAPSGAPIRLYVHLDGEASTDSTILVTAVPQKRTVVIAGTVTSIGPLSALLVNSVPTVLGPGGRFRAEVELPPGQSKVDFVGVLSDLSIAKATREVQVAADSEEPLGRQYAILIGVQQYEKWAPLVTPLADVRGIARILRDRYGFSTTIPSFGDLVLENPDKIRVGAAFAALRRGLTDVDSLLVYYAGHGKVEGERQRGYWILRDSDPENRATWYSGQELLAEIADMKARHVLVISDSCFADALTRDLVLPAVERSDADRRRLERASRTSRILITSGYNEPVLDSGGQGHSVFARALINGLEQIPHERFVSFELYSDYIYEQVGGRSPQQPHHFVLKDSGHGGGDMLFVTRSTRK